MPPEPPRDQLSGPAWTREQAAEITRTPATVTPPATPPETGLSDEVYAWDTWLLRDRDGEVAVFDGYRVVFALTAPRDRLPGKRHDVAQLRWFYSADGQTWHDGGPVFDGGALGSRQWAGCAIIERGTGSTGGDGQTVDVYVYYTAAGRRDEQDLTYSQRIAIGHGGRLVSAGDGLQIRGEWQHSTLLEPDGRYYETENQSRGMIYTFRDPWFFQDPISGRTHLLFEANVPVPEESDACDGDPTQQEFNGCVGIADSPTGDPADFRLRPPLFHSVCVNQELERPHMIVRDGRYYLFVSSHEHTFAPGIRGFDALYGFVADQLHGDYRPLNGSGLVLTNPATEPFQAYSWVAYPHRSEILVTGFLNYYNLEGRTLDEVADLPPPEQHRRFGGTLTPTARLVVSGDRTRICGTLGHGHLPLPSEPLPEPAMEDRPTAADLRNGDGQARTDRSYLGRDHSEYHDVVPSEESGRRPDEE